MRCSGLIADFEGGAPASDYLTGGGEPQPQSLSNVGISHCAEGSVGSAIVEHRENDVEEFDGELDTGWIRVDGNIDFGPRQPDVTVYATRVLDRSFEVPALQVNDDISRIRVSAEGDVPGNIVTCHQSAAIDGLGDSFRLCWLECDV